MALSASGMKTDIIDELPGTPVLDAGGAGEAIQAIATAIVDEIADNGTASVTTSSTGTCGNIPGPPPAPGPYAGAGSLTDGGTISGLSSSRLKTAIQDEVEALLDDIDWAENGDEITEAVAEAIVDEVEDNGKVAATTTETGTVPAGGGAVSGSGVGTGTVTSLSASGLHSAIKTKISSKVGTGVDFTVGDVDDTILALATGVVGHIHDNASVSVSTDLSTIICPPAGAGAPPTAADASDTGATIS